MCEGSGSACVCVCGWGIGMCEAVDLHVCVGGHLHV